MYVYGVLPVLRSAEVAPVTERAKHRVLGARQRSVQAAGAFDHTTGEGFVARHDGDYHDAINHRKANVKLVLHGALGGAGA